jgi:hypothetical protein
MICNEGGLFQKNLWSDDISGKNQARLTLYMRSCVHFDAHLQANIFPVTPREKQKKTSILNSEGGRG